MDHLKDSLGKSIANRIRSGEKLVFGTGSTVDRCFAHIKRRMEEGELENIEVMATSEETESSAKELGLKIIPISDANNVSLNWGFDGADLIFLPKNKTNKRISVIKGGGGAHFRERLAADILLAHNKPYLIIADSSKIATKASELSVPLEIIPEAKNYISSYLKQNLGAIQVSERPREQAKYGKDCYDIRRNIILDAVFKNLPEGLSKELHNITGVLTSGLFEHYASRVLIAHESGIETYDY